MAIEDAAVLAECLATVQNSSTDLYKAVFEYQELRKPRVGHAREITRGNADLFMLPDGPEQEARDARFMQQMKNMEKEEEDLKNGTLKQRFIPEPDPNASNFWTPGARMWLYGTDVVEEVREDLYTCHCQHLLTSRQRQSNIWLRSRP